VAQRNRYQFAAMANGSKEGFGSPNITSLAQQET
jgi:hypothetical protein